MSTAPLVEFRNVTVVRGDRAALDRVSLSIAPGEHVAILGPNGSGKSTLIKTITRECYPIQATGSSVRILGEELWNVFDLRVLVGIVSGDLFENCRWDVSGEEAVLSGFFSSIGIWPNHEVTARMRKKALEALARLGAAHLAARSIHEMSSGELRRVLIARALVHDPKALVLDEPSNSLDIHARRQLLGALSRLAAGGISIVMVTHQLEDILPDIRRVILLRRGRVFRDGPKDAMLTPDLLSAVFETPVAVDRFDGRYRMR
ncbi:MAG: ATP-binding cassette domain-containing protein [Bryobacterales bacterium]|nr:ATP-binding cassette domain-containing protein [Bryobacterales bacterium]